MSQTGANTERRGRERRAITLHFPSHCSVFLCTCVSILNTSRGYVILQSAKSALPTLFGVYGNVGNIGKYRLYTFCWDQKKNAECFSFSLFTISSQHLTNTISAFTASCLDPPLSSPQEGALICDCMVNLSDV